MSPEYLIQRALLLLVTGLCGLALTVGAWVLARRDAQSGARAAFDIQVAEIAVSIEGRILDYEQVLRGGAGLFAASAHVERDEWRAYAETTRVASTYPGILGFGYAPYVRRDARTAFEAAARRDGEPAFRVFPEGERAAYVPVLYLVPDNPVNRRALGYDMLFERLRREAIEHAIDAGAAALTRPVTLVQDAGGEPQPAFLMYLPVFRRGATPGGVVERRAEIEGFVYAPFRFSELIAGSVGERPGISIRLSDVTDPGAPIELYRSPVGQTRRDLPVFARDDRFRAAQRTWELAAQSLPSFEADASSNRPAIALAGGLAITALLMLLVWTLTSTRERARELARHMTVALRASEERLQLALASSHLALFDWDVASGLVQLSAEWSVMLGGPAEPSLMPVQKLQLLDHPEDRAAVAKTVRALVEGTVDECRFEHRIRRQGGWLWVETVARVNQRRADGIALRITGANADITERKAVERMKSEFIATVNHELRTPLTSMMGSLGLLREGAAGPLGADAGRFVEIAYANTERLAGLVNDILDMERIDAGRVEFHPEPIDVATLFARGIELNAGYADRYGVRFAPASPAGLRVRADPDRTMQVLTNLMSNAAKVSPRGAEVALSAQARPGAVRLSVSDSGPGVPAELRPRLFGRFEQAEGAQGGSGLGLAISKSLVERMGGRIGCDSEPGRGATFWFELPAA